MIIPAYNAEKFLAKCVESAANQTYKNIEIIVVDNGSQDSTPQICEDLKSKYNNIKVVTLNPNQGTNRARKAGIEASIGEYIATVDADDYIDLTAYEKAIKILEANDCDMVQFGYYEVTPDGKILTEYKREPVTTDNSHDAFKYYASFIMANLTLLWDKVYKRSMFDNLDWPKVSYTEDYCTDTQLFAKAKKFIAIEDCFYYHTVNPDSVCNSTALSSNRISDFITGSEFVADFTSKAMPEFLPEILNYSNYINMAISSGGRDKQCHEIWRIDYTQMRLELEKQGRKLYMYNRQLTRKQKIFTWLSAYHPSLYRTYLKTRLKIRDLTGI